jgi:aspartyl-tRNA synthetase
MQSTVFEMLGIGPEEAQKKFGFLLEALKYGAPPHGGMAAGIERMVMLLTGCSTVRDVALFPMNQQAKDLLMGAPSDVTIKQLRELHIRVVQPEKKA